MYLLLKMGIIQVYWRVYCLGPPPNAGSQCRSHLLKTNLHLPVLQAGAFTQCIVVGFFQRLVILLFTKDGPKNAPYKWGEMGPLYIGLYNPSYPFIFDYFFRGPITRS